MGVMPDLFCSCNSSQPAPNPRPDRYELKGMYQFNNAHLLIVRYLDCTNFEGLKAMVFAGKYEHREFLDPHFSESKGSPIARFRPDNQGLALALDFAKNYKGK